jgi:SAM-dependent MidA family methyltransferase
VSLLDKIAGEIHERGPIPFSRYMEMCLYQPESGFYSRDIERFGKAGDFYTSSDVHALFGRLVARQFEEMWRVLGRPGPIQILELGPGRGLFARDVLEWSQKKYPEFYEAMHYSLCERSKALRTRLLSILNQHLESGKVSIGSASPALATDSKSADSGSNEGEGPTSVVPNGVEITRALVPEVPIIVFANEFFDALPVEILSHKGKLFVHFCNGHFTECWKEPSRAELDLLEHYSVPPEPGERLEISLPAQLYMQEIARIVQRGFALVIDYGYTREQQLAGRHRGTLMSFRQHAAITNPYQAAGEQDITAHVNFTGLGAAAERGGMLVQPLITQSQFLLGIGEANQFADAFEECAAPQERAKVALQLKHLITPAGMGESFHVMLASKGLDSSVVTNLSGTSFGKRTVAAMNPSSSPAAPVDQTLQR